MTAKLIAPILAAFALAGCAGGDRPAGGAGIATTASAPAPVGFIGPDGPLVAAPPEVNHALETAIIGSPLTWTDAETGAVTRFTAVRTFQREDNSYCREFTETVTIKDKTDAARGTACRQSDGTWRAAAG
jgi:hypothetical protein